MALAGDLADLGLWSRLLESQPQRRLLLRVWSSRRASRR